jgi:cell division protein FtsB
VRPRVVGGALVVLLLAGLAVYGWQGVVRLRQMREQLQSLERENLSLRREAERLAQVIDRLRNDPAYLERIAREERGMVRPGETVLKFPAKDKASQ